MGPLPARDEQGGRGRRDDAALTLVPQVALSKENLDTYYSGTSPKLNAPVPAEDAYLEPYLEN